MVKDDLPAPKKVKPLVIAHRGDSAHAPENTLAALRMAIDAGADGVEFDVRLAKDGVPVVIHDSTLKRTAGLNLKVGYLTSANLAKIDAGACFDARHPGRARSEYALESVPTLTSALEMLAGFGGLIYIELKCGHKFVPLVHAVCDLLRGSPMLPRIIVKSFRMQAIPGVRASLPDVTTAALFQPSVKNVLRRRQSIVETARAYGAIQLSIHRTLATPRLVDLAHRANMPVTVWTVDDPKWIRRARKLGINALITNDPARMLAARDEDH